MTYTISRSKNSYFLITIVVSAILISIPVISNHFLHPSHYFHIAIHEAGFILAVFLVGITIIAYKETKFPRLLFSLAAFTALAIGQLIYMLEKMNIPEITNMSSTGEGFFDVAILIMTAIFAVGIFYKH